MIVFADLHLKEDSEQTVFEQVLPGLLSAVRADPDKTLACLGDFFHVRYRIPVYLQNRVLEWLELLEQTGIRLLLLPGNHDQINYQGENALEVFRKFANVDVLSQPQWNEYGYWIPYRKRLEDVVEALEAGHRTQEGKPPVLWMHHGIRGAYMSDRVIDTTGIPVEDLKRWVVLCGHYHIRQRIGTVTYIGSPYQSTAREAGQQDKGFASWNPTTLQLQWFNANWGKRYHNLGMTAGQELDLTGVRPGDEVRVTTLPGVDPVPLSRILEQLGAKAVLTPQLTVSGARLAVANNSGLTDYARAYVDQFAGELDKSRLMSIYESFNG